MGRVRPPGNAPCLRPTPCPHPCADEMRCVPLAPRGASEGKSYELGPSSARRTACSGSAVLETQAPGARRVELRKGLSASTRDLTEHQLPQARALLHIFG